MTVSEAHQGPGSVPPFPPGRNSDGQVQRRATRQPHARSAATRARLLAAAAQAFAEKGFHATSTRDIAALADVSPTAMYAHHSSKKELLYQLSLSSHQKALEVVSEAANGPGSPSERLRRLVRDLAVHHAVSHVVSRVANYELAALSEEHLDEILALRRSITQIVRAVVDEGIAAQEFERTHARFAVSAIISQCVDISRWYRESGVPADEIAEAYAELAVRSLWRVGDVN